MGNPATGLRQLRQTRPHIQENFTFDGGVRCSKKKHRQSFRDKYSNCWRGIPVNFDHFLESSRELAPGNSSNMNEFDAHCSPLQSEGESLGEQFICD
jgi:hypothetical protein